MCIVYVVCNVCARMVCIAELQEVIHAVFIPYVYTIHITTHNSTHYTQTIHITTHYAQTAQMDSLCVVISIVCADFLVCAICIVYVVCDVCV